MSAPAVASRAIVAVVALILVAGGGVLFAALGSATAGQAAGAPVAQADTGWMIERFDVAIDVAPDGRFVVQETIAVDFGSLQRRGILRNIPFRYESTGTHDRVIEIDAISVRTSEGTPDRIQVSNLGDIRRPHLKQIRIGDPDIYISGRHTYEIAYRIRGALNSFPEHEELFWNVTGNEWPVTIVEASATVRGPAIVRVACFRGALGATSECDRSSLESDSQATFATQGVAPTTGMTVVVGFAPGSVDPGEPILVERWSLARAFSLDAVPLAAAIATALLAFGALALLAYRQGRDRVTHGGVTVDGRAEERPRPLFDRWPVPVQFRPPDGLRPAQVGLIVDERVDPVDISATVVDLAVRGHLTIVEIPKQGWFGKADWRLVRRDNPGDALLPYEKRLYDALFEDGDEVELSDLRGSFHTDYAAVRKAIYDDAMKRKWFRRRPDRVRNLWLTLGILATGASLALLVVAVLFTRLGWAAAMLLLASLTLAALHRWMPHRTAKGSHRLRETLGFKEFIETAEQGRMEFAEDENLFVSYLPYAVVFGAVDKWARAFAGLGAAATAAASSWYVGSHGVGDLTGLSGGLSDFASNVGGGLARTPASSGSSGFGGGGGGSGGGFGGGGGGSW